MSTFNRFFGKREADDQPDDLLAWPKKDGGPALQVLFADNFKFDAEAVTQAMRAYHPALAKARCEVVEELNLEGKIFGLAGWGDHVIQLVGFDRPMPRDSIEACIAPSHYPESLKQRAREHTAHLLLWYAGQEQSGVEPFVVLAAFAGVLDRFGGLVVLNESGHTSFPTSALRPAGQDSTSDMLKMLRHLPLPALYCGFVKYNVPGDTSVWMRTYEPTCWTCPTSRPGPPGTTRDSTTSTSSTASCATCSRQASDLRLAIPCRSGATRLCVAGRRGRTSTGWSARASCWWWKSSGRRRAIADGRGIGFRSCDYGWACQDRHSDPQRGIGFRSCDCGWAYQDRHSDPQRGIGFRSCDCGWAYQDRQPDPQRGIGFRSCDCGWACQERHPDTPGHHHRIGILCHGVGFRSCDFGRACQDRHPDPQTRSDIGEADFVGIG